MEKGTMHVKGQAPCVARRSYVNKSLGYQPGLLDLNSMHFEAVVGGL